MNRQYKVGDKVIRKRTERSTREDDDAYWTCTIVGLNRKSEYRYLVDGPCVPDDRKNDWFWHSDFFEHVPTKLEKFLGLT